MFAFSAMSRRLRDRLVFQLHIGELVGDSCLLVIGRPAADEIDEGQIAPQAGDSLSAKNGWEIMVAREPFHLLLGLSE